MGNRDQFKTRRSTNPEDRIDCSTMMLWLNDAAEDRLPEELATQVRSHAVSCSACQETLTQARQGREWLLLLKQEELEVPAGLLLGILANTTARVDANYNLPDTDRHTDIEKKVQPAEWQSTSLAVLRRRAFEPRIGLVAAMAFFSISLTLNLLGVRITQLRVADLKPEILRRAVTRQYAEANARAVRYYDNLRIVNELESRVQEIRQATETSTPQKNASRPNISRSSGSSHPGQRERTWEMERA